MNNVPASAACSNCAHFRPAQPEIPRHPVEMPDGNWRYTNLIPATPASCQRLDDADHPIDFATDGYDAVIVTITRPDDFYCSLWTRHE